MNAPNKRSPPSGSATPPQGKKRHPGESGTSSLNPGESEFWLFARHTWISGAASDNDELGTTLEERMKGKVWVETPSNIHIPKGLIDIVKNIFLSLRTTDLIIRVTLTPAHKLLLRPDGKLRLSYRTSVSANAEWKTADIGVDKRFWNSYIFPMDPALIPVPRRDQPSRFPPPQPPVGRTSIWGTPSSAARRLAESSLGRDPETAGEAAAQIQDEPARAWHQITVNFLPDGDVSLSLRENRTLRGWRLGWSESYSELTKRLKQDWARGSFKGKFEFQIRVEHFVIGARQVDHMRYSKSFWIEGTGTTRSKTWLLVGRDPVKVTPSARSPMGGSKMHDTGKGPQPPKAAGINGTADRDDAGEANSRLDARGNNPGRPVGWHNIKVRFSGSRRPGEYATAILSLSDNKTLRGSVLSWDEAYPILMRRLIEAWRAGKIDPNLARFQICVEHGVLGSRKVDFMRYRHSPDATWTFLGSRVAIKPSTPRPPLQTASTAGIVSGNNRTNSPPRPSANAATTGPQPPSVVRDWQRADLLEGIPPPNNRAGKHAPWHTVKVTLSESGQAVIDLSDTQTLKGWTIRWPTPWYQETLAKIARNMSGSLPVINAAETSWRIRVKQDKNNREVEDMQRKARSASQWTSVKRLR